MGEDPLGYVCMYVCMYAYLQDFEQIFAVKEGIGRQANHERKLISMNTITHTYVCMYVCMYMAISLCICSLIITSRRNPNITNTHLVPDLLPTASSHLVAVIPLRLGLYMIGVLNQ